MNTKCTTYGRTERLRRNILAPFLFLLFLLCLHSHCSHTEAVRRAGKASDAMQTASTSVSSPLENDFSISNLRNTTLERRVPRPPGRRRRRRATPRPLPRGGRPKRKWHSRVGVGGTGGTFRSRMASWGWPSAMNPSFLLQPSGAIKHCDQGEIVPKTASAGTVAIAADPA